MRRSFPVFALLVLLVLASIPARAQDLDPAALENLRRTFQTQDSLAFETARTVALDLGLPIREALPDGTVTQLVGLEETGRPIYLITNNTVSAASIRTTAVQPGGSTGLNLDGSGMVIGEWDGGLVRTTHEQFAGRVTQMDGATALSDHATHVCGTMIGDGTGEATALGMAQNAEVEAYDFFNDDAEIAGAAAGLLLSNHSYGRVTGWRFSGGDWYWYGEPSVDDDEDPNFGRYGPGAANWDQIARNAPDYLIVKSAGNDRGDAPFTNPTPHFIWGGSGWVIDSTYRLPDGGLDGYDCIPTEGNAKNILTAGAVDDIPAGHSSPSDVVASSFHGWGPTDDGRIKPDICANGIGLFSAGSAADDAYSSKSGTSMSAPSVTGSAVLLQQHHQALNAGASMTAATLKALILHTADEAGPAPGPDYMFGWGLMNTERAASVITADQALDDHIIEATLGNGSTYSITVYQAPGKDLRATIVWTDPAGSSQSYLALDDPTPRLVHDLDLRVSDGVTTDLPYTLDPANPSDPATTGDNVRDNVEQVLRPSGGCGPVTITVTHKGALTTASQDFSLILTGIVQAPTLALDAAVDTLLGLPSDACSGPLRPVIRLRNDGLDTLWSASLTTELNGTEMASFTWSGSIPPTCFEDIVLLPFTPSSGAGQTVRATVSEPNGSIDLDPTNDAFDVGFDFSPFGGTAILPPLVEDFESGIPASWIIGNPDGDGFTWSTQAANSCSFGTSATVEHYDYDPGTGQIDSLTLPMIDARGLDSLVLSFDVAYRPWGSGYQDRLEVRASTDCDASARVVYGKTGLDLATAGGTSFPNAAWTPSSCADWRRDTIVLHDLTGGYLRLAFVTTNGWGNDIFLDNVRIEGTTCPVAASDLELSDTLRYCGTDSVQAVPAPSGYDYLWFRDGGPMVPSPVNRTVGVRDNGTYQVLYHGGRCDALPSDPLVVINEGLQTDGLASKGAVASPCRLTGTDTWMYLEDATGNALGRMRDGGNDLGAVTLSSFDHGATPPFVDDRHVLTRSWRIETEKEPTSPVEVQLYAGGGEVAVVAALDPTVTDVTDLVLTKRDPGVLGDPTAGTASLITPVGTSGAGPDGSDMLSFQVDGFSTFFAHAGPTVLPVELIAFSGRALDQDRNRLDWSTASEKDNDRFVVTASTDGLVFRAIGSVDGAGDSDTLRTYAYVHGTREPIVYYRLEQIDLDGTMERSRVVVIERSIAGQDIDIRPNPARSKVTLHAPPGSDRWRIIDLQGMVRGTGAFNGATTVEISLVGWAPGPYIVECIAAQGVVRRRLVKL